MAIGPNPPGSHPSPDEDEFDPPVRQDIRLGNEGYAEEAEALTRQYESVGFADVHRHVLHLIPKAPSDVLDIGAGTVAMPPRWPRWAIAWLPWSRLPSFAPARRSCIHLRGSNG